MIVAFSGFFIILAYSVDMCIITLYLPSGLRQVHLETQRRWSEQGLCLLYVESLRPDFTSQLELRLTSLRFILS